MYCSGITVQMYSNSVEPSNSIFGVVVEYTITPRRPDSRSLYRKIEVESPHGIKRFFSDDPATDVPLSDDTTVAVGSDATMATTENMHRKMVGLKKLQRYLLDVFIQRKQRGQKKKCYNCKNILVNFKKLRMIRNCLLRYVLTQFFLLPHTNVSPLL